MEEYVGRFVKVIVDRLLGAKHPSHGFFYSLNYSYAPGMFSGDGEEIDAYNSFGL